MSQVELLEKPISADVFVILRTFENYRGVDVEQDIDDICHQYHSVYLEPKAPKASWSGRRVISALGKAMDQGLVYQPYSKILGRTHNYCLTQKGIEARRAETVRRMGL